MLWFGFQAYITPPRPCRLQQHSRSQSLRASMSELALLKAQESNRRLNQTLEASRAVLKSDCAFEILESCRL